MDRWTFSNARFGRSFFCSRFRQYFSSSGKVKNSFFFLPSFSSFFVVFSATLNNSKFRSQHNKTDHQKPQWLCRLSVNNESVRLDCFEQNLDVFFCPFLLQKLDLMPIFSSHTKSKLCQIYRADSSGQISVWSINLKNFSTNQTDKSLDISATWSISYKDVWTKTLSQMNSVEKVLNHVRFLFICFEK